MNLFKKIKFKNYLFKKVWDKIYFRGLFKCVKKMVFDFLFVLIS